MAHELYTLKSRHLECVELEMAHTDWTSRELSEALGVSQKTVCQWRKSPAYKAEIDKRIRERYKEYAKRAQEELAKIAFDPTTGKRDRITALTYINKCGNFEPAQKQEVQLSTEGITINIDNTKPQQ